MTLAVKASVPQRRIQTDHTRRKAVVYVRQSSVGQLERNRESTALQYGLHERAVQLGWPRSHIEVIDDDQGLSGRSATDRHGFMRMVAETGLGHVGIIISYDVSRLSRNLADWGKLLELCGRTSTLIADVESVYDMNWSNDRFLLGIKGTMSEVELHVLHQRMHAEREAKASRGELSYQLPRGYVRDSAGAAILDPDAGVQASVRDVFHRFAECASLAATLRVLNVEGQLLPNRLYSGVDRGQLVWRRANTATLYGMLTNPIYAGAFS